MTPEARLAAAIELLEGIEAEPRRPADALAAAFFRARRYMGGGDRRAVADLVWGVLRQRLRLAWWLGARASPRALVLAHLLLAERRAPGEVARLFAGGRHGARPLDPEERALAGALAGRPLLAPEMPEGPRLNIPDWALPGFAARFGPRLAEEAAALERPAPVDLRANTLKADRAAARAALARDGLAAEPTPLAPHGLRLRDRAPLAATAAYREGLVEVQDEGSQILAALVGARPGMRVADLCAGAAGKTLALAAAMGNRGRITACDVSAPRLAAAARRLRRAGVQNAETHLLTPGDRWAKRRAGGFDRVLVDAPCTGTGTWRRNPDARGRTTGADLQELVTKQREILATSAQLVRPGGRLVYATCSLLPEEDEVQVERFLSEHPAFRLVPAAQAWREAGLPGAAPAPGLYLLLTPAAQGTDGFFAAVLERRG